MNGNRLSGLTAVGLAVLLLFVGTGLLPACSDRDDGTEQEPLTVQDCNARCDLASQCGLLPTDVTEQEAVAECNRNCEAGLSTVTGMVEAQIRCEARSQGCDEYEQCRYVDGMSGATPIY